MLSVDPLKRYVLVLLTLLFVQAPLAHSALIGLQPDTTFAASGDSIALDLVISDLGDFGPDSLGAFDISVGFDDSVLSFSSYNLGGFLGDVAMSEAIDASTGDVGGAVNVAEVSLLSISDLNTLQPGEFILATLNFNVVDLVGGAMTQLSVLSGAVLADALGEGIEPAGLGTANVKGFVPLPGTLYLVAVSILAWLTLKTRQATNK